MTIVLLLQTTEFETEYCFNFWMVIF